MVEGLVIDFSDVPDNNLVPAGTYQLEVVEMKLVESGGEKTFGQPMLKAHFKIIEHDDLENRRVFDNIVLTQEAGMRWKAKQLFVSILGGAATININNEELPQYTGARLVGTVSIQKGRVVDGVKKDDQNRIRYIPPDKVEQELAKSAGRSGDKFG